jgi:hypothetical protein
LTILFCRPREPAAKLSLDAFATKIHIENRGLVTDFVIPALARAAP